MSTLITDPIVVSWCRRMGATVPSKGDYRAIQRIASSKAGAAERDQFDLTYTAKIGHLLFITGRQVAAVYHDSPHVDSVLRVLEDRVTAPLQETIASLLLTVEKAFGRDALSAVRSKAASDIEDWDPLTSSELVEWNKTRLAAHVIDIAKSTRNSISKIILQGVEEGWSTERIAKRISDSYAFSYQRAETIAQTEVTAAAAAGKRYSIKANISNYAKLTKTWSAVSDRRTRPSHNTANGQERKFNTPYNVGGSRLMFPGDTSLGASATEIVRCRCTETYSR